MEWIFPYYWTAVANPTAWWSAPSSAETTAGDGYAGPDDLDLDLVRIVYGALVEQMACGDCGAPLDSVSGVGRIRVLFTGRRIMVGTYCRGPRRHRHLAKVIERAGDLRFGQLRPA